MTLITTNSALRAFCDSLRSQPFITVDTEFLRDKTYYSKLCLIQLSGPDKRAVAVDVLSKEEEIDLSPVWDLMTDPSILKVFHAARQDLEIILQLSGKMVAPLFDTQVAAMVCGHGEQIGYDSLVAEIIGHRPDKSSQFTDWSHRPLSARQLSYALNDVIYLIDIYLSLSKELEKTGRTDWVDEEMEFLTSPSTYDMNPDEAWKRLKIRSAKPRDLGVISELAKWREQEAQRKDVPRSRILRDETLLDLGFQQPQTPEDLLRIRGFTPDMARGKLGTAIMNVIGAGLKLPDDKLPRMESKISIPQKLTSMIEMLKMLLRIQANEAGVAIKLIASSDDIDTFVMNPKAPVGFNHGWRYEVFGQAAHELMQGKLCLTIRNGSIKLLPIDSHA